MMWLRRTVLVALLNSTPTAWADIGPKPSIAITFGPQLSFEPKERATQRREFDPPPCEYENVRLMLCADATCSRASELRRLGPAGLCCSSRGCSGISYGFPDHLRLDVLLDGRWHPSNVFRYEWDARFRADLVGGALVVERVAVAKGRVVSGYLSADAIPIPDRRRAVLAIAPSRATIEDVSIDGVWYGATTPFDVAPSCRRATQTWSFLVEPGDHVVTVRWAARRPNDGAIEETLVHVGPGERRLVTAETSRQPSSPPQSTPPRPPPPPLRKGEPIVPRSCATPIRVAYGTESLPTPEAASGDGVLVVRALAYVDIKVCETSYGNAPLELRVRTGKYTVEVDHPCGTRTRRVAVHAGRRAQITVDGDGEIELQRDDG